MLFVLHLLFAASEFQLRATSDGCGYYQGGVQDDRVAIMRAECEWPDVEFEILDALLHDVEAYDEYFDVIRSSDILDSRPDADLVYQVQKVSGLKAREILQWMSKEHIGDDTCRHTWITASDVPLEPEKGHVRAERSDGSWLIQRREDGTVTATYQLAYDPGGKVPAWVVRRLQLKTFRRTVAELHDLAAERSIEAD